MRYALIIFALLACGDSTGPKEEPLPVLLPGYGVIRLQTGSSCPTLTLILSVDGQLHGPHTFSANQGIDLAYLSTAHTTSARTTDNARTWPAQDVQVVEGKRTTRTLNC